MQIVLNANQPKVKETEMNSKLKQCMKTITASWKKTNVK